MRNLRSMPQVVPGTFVAAIVLLATAPALAQVASFDPAIYGRANLRPDQSYGGTDEMIKKSNGAFEPLSTLRADEVFRKAARPIGRIDVVLREADGKESLATCTGALLKGDRVLTNNHCIPAAGTRRPVRASILMNYLNLDGDGSKRFELNVTPLATDATLDFSIVAAQGSPTREYGTVSLSTAPIQPNQSLVVFHHPEGRPMMMTRFRCQAYREQKGDAEVRHRCDTLGGSSGSLLFSTDLKAVALHHAGGLTPGDENSYNLATRISALAKATNLIGENLESAETPKPPVADAGGARPADTGSARPADTGSARPADTGAAPAVDVEQAIRDIFRR